MKSSPLAAALAFVGIVLTLIYMLRLVQELLFQGERQPLPLVDLSLRELPDGSVGHFFVSNFLEHLPDFRCG